MPVPIATVNEDRLPAAFEDQIRFAGECRIVEAIAEPKGEHQTANDQLRFGVLSPDGLHNCAALLRRKLIGHAGNLYTAMSNGRSLISRRRRPSTIVFRSSMESS